MPQATGPAAAPKKRLIPRDAATLVLVDRKGAEPRVLMGRRRADLAFMANKFVFPGGRVDLADKTAPSASELGPAVIDKLLIEMRGRPSSKRARALAIAAIREMHEETGLVLGDAGNPPLEALRFFARAITPPDRPRRFDTRFFMADAALATHTTLAGDGELVELAWFTLAETQSLDLPGITRRIVGDIGALWGALLDGRSNSEPVIPFYRFRAGRFQRDLI